MKTLILNVLLKVTQNILTFCKMYDNAFKQGKNTLNAGASQNLLQVFLGSVTQQVFCII